MTVVDVISASLGLGEVAAIIGKLCVLAYSQYITFFRPYECNKCHAVFTRQHSLNYHLLIHANSTRFTCTDCGRKFRHPSHFKEHRRRHTGESPFSCSHCDQKYKTRNTYKRHLKVQHGTTLQTSEATAATTSDATKKKTLVKRDVAILKNGRTIRPKVGKIENADPPSSVAVNKSVVKKSSEDDFIVDYHYGDSVSNDEEVARINHKKLQRRKASVEVGPSAAAASTSSSYYPSTNSEFSTPEVAEDLPKFGAKPPPGVSGVAMTVKKLSEESAEQSVHLTFSATPSVSGNQTQATSAAAPNPDRIVTTKPAFLAQINGQQVLLIPEPTPDLQIQPTAATSTAEVKPKVEPPLFVAPSTSRLTTAFVSPASGPSKLEQCLRYGSAAVTQNHFGGQRSNLVQVKKFLQQPHLVKLSKPQIIAPKPKTSIALVPTTSMTTQTFVSTPKVFVVKQEATSGQHQLMQQHPPTLTTLPSQSWLTPEVPRLFQSSASTMETTETFTTFDVVPEVVYEEEVTSCEDFSAEFSVQIESSDPSPNQEIAEPHFYDPKWSPEVRDNRDRILCDLLGIQN